MTEQSDDLRTRIAETVWVSHRDRQMAQLGMKPSPYAAELPTPDWAYAIADSVIDALNLEVANIYPTSAGYEICLNGHYTKWVRND